MTVFKTIAESNSFIVLDKYCKNEQVYEHFQSEIELEGNTKRSAVVYGCCTLIGNGAMPQNPWGYDFELRCPEIVLPPPKGSNAAPRNAFPSLIIRQQVRNLKEAKQMIGKVASTELVEDGGKLFVDTYVPMYIMPPFYDRSQEIEIRNGQLYFTPISCPAGTKREVVVLPKKICGVDGVMKGYRVDVVRPLDAHNYKQKLLFQVKDSHNNWVDGFQACGISINNYKEIFSIHQICQNQ